MINVFTDGSSSKKNNSIGSGYVCFSDEKYIMFENNYGIKNTNKTGFSELIAIYLALKKLIKSNYNNEEIKLYSDSQYAVKELNIWFKDHLSKRFVNTKNSELILLILYLKTFFSNLNIEWIKGHQDKKSFYQYGNDLADKLAKSSHIKIDNLISYQNLFYKIKIFNKKENLLNKMFDYYILNANEK